MFGAIVGGYAVLGLVAGLGLTVAGYGLLFAVLLPLLAGGFGYGMASLQMTRRCPQCRTSVRKDAKLCKACRSPLAFR